MRVLHAALISAGVIKGVVTRRAFCNRYLRTVQGGGRSTSTRRVAVFPYLPIRVAVEDLIFRESFSDFRSNA